MHYTLTVALPAHIETDKLRDALTDALAPFDEQLDVEPYVAITRTEVLAEIHAAASKDSDWARNYAAEIATLTNDEKIQEWDGTDQFDLDGNPMSTRNPNGKWDWWVIGGRWGGHWTLKPGAQSGLESEDHAFGRTPESDDEQRTDCARLQDIEPESLDPTYAYITLEGQWHGRWLGVPDNDFQYKGQYEVPPEEFAAQYLQWITALPVDTWLINVDYHT